MSLNCQFDCGGQQLFPLIHANIIIVFSILLFLMQQSYSYLGLWCKALQSLIRAYCLAGISCTCIPYCSVTYYKNRIKINTTLGTLTIILTIKSIYTADHKNVPLYFSL